MIIVGLDSHIIVARSLKAGDTVMQYGVPVLVTGVQHSLLDDVIGIHVDGIDLPIEVPADRELMVVCSGNQVANPTALL